jgi:hypothetical protein
MADQQPVARKQSRSKRDKKQEADPGAGKTGDENEIASYEKELAGYLQQRIKPGLNSGAIPLLARSIAKDIAHRERPNGASADSDANGDGEPSAEADDEATARTDDEPDAQAQDQTGAQSEDETDAQGDEEPDAQADEEPDAQADDEADAQEDDEPSAEAEGDESGDEGDASDFEADMHDLQAELGEDWILRFSVQGGAAWLTAEKDDGSQRVEAPTATVISEAVELLNQGGGRGT